MTKLWCLLFSVLFVAIAEAGTLCQDVQVGEGGSTRALTTNTNSVGDLLWDPQVGASPQGTPFVQSYQGKQVVNGHDDPINCPVLITGWSCMVYGSPNPSGGNVQAFIVHAALPNLSRSKILQLGNEELLIPSGFSTSKSTEIVLPTPVRLAVGDKITFTASGGFLSSAALACYMHWKKL